MLELNISKYLVYACVEMLKIHYISVQFVFDFSFHFTAQFIWRTYLILSFSHLLSLSLSLCTPSSILLRFLLLIVCAEKFARQGAGAGAGTAEKRRQQKKKRKKKKAHQRELLRPVR